MSKEERTIEEIRACIKEIDEVLLKHNCKLEPQNEGAVITKQGVILGFV